MAWFPAFVIALAKSRPFVVRADCRRLNGHIHVDRGKFIADGTVGRPRPRTERRAIPVRCCFWGGLGRHGVVAGDSITADRRRCA